MKKIVSIVALLISVVLIFSACVTEEPHLGEGGSDVEVSATLHEELSSDKNTLSDDKLIALTFDDGPNPVSTNRILDILEKHGSKATFFVVGYNIEKNIETISRAVSIGCEIGNHTADHKILTKCSNSVLREQVDKPNEQLKSITGNAPVLFRAPGGAFKGITDEIGMPLIQWSIDTEDWKYKDASNADRTEEERNADLERIANDVIENVEKGDIVLMHDIYNFTADLCDIIVPALAEKGFKLVTVSEMYEAYGQPLEPGKVYRYIEFNEGSDSASNLQVAIDPGEYKVKTNGGKLNLRAEPKQDTVIIEKIDNGTSVTVVKSVPGWSFVKTVSASGWVNSAYLSK